MRDFVTGVLHLRYEGVTFVPFTATMSTNKTTDRALYMRYHRWRRSSIKKAGRYYVVRSYPKGVKDMLTEGEKLDAVLNAARLNNWL